MSQDRFKFVATMADLEISHFGGGDTPEEALESFLAGPVYEYLAEDSDRAYSEAGQVTISSVIHNTYDKDEAPEEFYGGFSDEPFLWITDRRISVVDIVWDYDEDEASNARKKDGDVGETDPFHPKDWGDLVCPNSLQKENAELKKRLKDANRGSEQTSHFNRHLVKQHSALLGAMNRIKEIINTPSITHGRRINEINHVLAELKGGDDE